MLLSALSVTEPEQKRGGSGWRLTEGKMRHNIWRVGLY